MWVVYECKSCEGNGIEWCPACEERCDHDKLCDTCKGFGCFPTRPNEIMGISISGIENKLFDTKTKAWDWIRTAP